MGSKCCKNSKAVEDAPEEENQEDVKTQVRESTPAPAEFKNAEKEADVEAEPEPEPEPEMAEPTEEPKAKDDHESTEVVGSEF
ncbi:unnamed protein product [Oikopleura dioica]|uniref:Uncharacterized protein n=1 Tax=Oikopleura dioica TaxID=34765 RepID=E4XKD3_OIKDI|nr:unnamed protein product [Oikopleura dioica]